MHQPLAVEGRHIGVGDTIEYMDNRGLWLRVRVVRIVDDSGWQLQSEEGSFVDWIRPGEVRNRLRLARVNTEDGGDDDKESRMLYGNENNNNEESNHVSGKRKASSSSNYRGVHRNKHIKSKPWAARISIDGKNKYLGIHATKEDAARAYDAEGARVGRELNFPEEWKNVEDIEEKYEALSYKKGKRKTPASKYRELAYSKVKKRSRGMRRSI